MLEGSCYKALNNKHIFSNGGITRAKDELTHLESEQEVGSCHTKHMEMEREADSLIAYHWCWTADSFRTLEDQTVWNNGGIPNLHKAQSKQHYRSPTKRDYTN